MKRSTPKRHSRHTKARHAGQKQPCMPAPDDGGLLHRPGLHRYPIQPRELQGMQAASSHAERRSLSARTRSCKGRGSPIAAAPHNMQWITVESCQLCGALQRSSIG